MIEDFKFLYNKTCFISNNVSYKEFQDLFSGRTRVEKKIFSKVVGLAASSAAASAVTLFSA